MSKQAVTTGILSCLCGVLLLALPVTVLAQAEKALEMLGVKPQSVSPAGGGDKAMDLPSSADWGGIDTRAVRPQKAAIADLPWFQTLIDQAPPGSTLKPPPGRYSGPVLLDKPLIIEGEGVSIDGGGRGTVFVLQTDAAVLSKLHLTGSGPSHDTDDACLNVRGNGNRVDGLRIDDCLFGIDLKKADHNQILNNAITSKEAELGTRGDGLRLWYSHNNLIAGNEVNDSRDMVAWYSDSNIFRDNVGRHSRYSLHFMFSHKNVVENNRFYDNAVGIYAMYTDGVVMRGNTITHATGAAGMAIGFKEASNALIEGNELIYCGTAIGVDLSPFEPDSTIEIRNNKIAYNGVGIAFLSDREGITIEGNSFDGNLSQVSVAAAGSAMKDVWQGNYWDDYQGFDRNADGIGDTPYELYAFADQIWMEQPSARFFRDTPVMELLDFLERLAPITSPTLILRDEKPLFRKPVGFERTEASSQ